jgi:hypothetical protein
MMNPKRVYRRQTKWVALGAAGFAIFLCVMSFLVFWLLQPVRKTQMYTHFEMTVVPAPTLTSTPNILITPTPTESAGLNGIRVGVFVQISGTDGTGLRIRSGAGTNTSLRFLGMDSEVFKVVDGPQKADGYTWWMLQAPIDQSRSGWAASQYLTVIDQAQ